MNRGNVSTFIWSQLYRAVHIWCWRGQVLKCRTWYSWIWRRWLMNLKTGPEEDKSYQFCNCINNLTKWTVWRFLHTLISSDYLMNYQIDYGIVLHVYKSSWLNLTIYTRTYMCMKDVIFINTATIQETFLWLQKICWR